jgi:hypothetical protein
VKREELDPRFYAGELVVVVSYSVGVIHRTGSSIAAASPTSYFTVHLHIFDSLICLLGFWHVTCSCDIIPVVSLFPTQPAFLPLNHHLVTLRIALSNSCVVALSSLGSGLKSETVR